jgi:hypothetical protein
MPDPLPGLGVHSVERSHVSQTQLRFLVIDFELPLRRSKSLDLTKYIISPDAAATRTTVLCMIEAKNH